MPLTTRNTSKEILQKFNSLDIQIEDLESKSSSLITVNTINDLMTIDPKDFSTIIVKEFNRGGVFNYFPTGYTIDNGIVFSTKIGGYWVRQYNDIANVKWWDVNENNTDNKINILKAINFCSTNNITLFFPDGVFITSPTTINVPIKIRLSDKCVLKLINNAGYINSEVYVLKLTQSNTSIIGGVIDGNRDQQDRINFNNNNANNNLKQYGLFIQGNSSNFINNITINTNIVNVADRALNVQYVNNSIFPFVQVDNSGTGAVFENTTTIDIGKIILNNLDNKNWRIYPHALDIFNSTDVTAGEIINNNQSGYSLKADLATLSDWFSGITITSCNNVNIDVLKCVAKKDSLMMKSLGVSLLANTDIKINHLEIRRYTDNHLEVGGCVRLTVDDFLIDGEYQTSSLWSGTKSTGINVYNNGYYSNFKSRSIRQSTDCKFTKGVVQRMLGYGGQFFTMSDCNFTSVDFLGNYIGAYFDYKNQDSSFIGSLVNKNQNNKFINCRFNNNESNGVLFVNGTNFSFDKCEVLNNGQAKTNTGNAYRHPSYGTLTSTVYGFLTFNSATAGAERIGTKILGGSVFDNQIITNRLASLNPSNPTVLSLNDPSIVQLGQSIKLIGAGNSGADLIAQVYDINKDEITINKSITTFPSVTGSGTITTNGLNVIGTGTLFSSELNGRFWIKVANEYKQIVSVSSDNNAILSSTFLSDLIDQPFSIIKINIQQIRSQEVGIRLANSSDINTIVDGVSYGTTNNISNNLQNDTGGNVTLGYDIKLPITITPNDLILLSGTPALELSSPSGRRKGWSFDQSINESVQGSIYIPKTFADKIKVTYYWINNATGTGSVAWDFTYAFIQNNNTAGVADTFVGLLPQVALGQELLNVSSFTNSITVVKDSMLSFRIFRNAASTPDTLPNDALLLMVVISEG